MKPIQWIFSAAYAAASLLFVCGGITILSFAALELWHAIAASADEALQTRLNSALEAVGLLTIAVAAFELGQTVLEEEVFRQSHLSAPTRVRRFLSRFMIVVVVALSVETLVAVFRLLHEDPEHLPQAASVGLCAAALLAAWGVFIKLNRSAEELEPEAMEDVKSEDKELDESK